MNRESTGGATERDDGALTADATAFVRSLLTSMLADPEGELSERSRRLIASLVEDIGRDLSGPTSEVIREILRRAERPAVVVGTLAGMTVQVIRALRVAGVPVEVVPSPYDLLFALEDPET